MKLLFKILGYSFALLFLIAAFLQYNDPDALVWMIIYGIAALVSLAFTLNKIGYKVLIALGFIAFVGFLYVYPANFQGFDLSDGDVTTVELGREAFGLLIIAIVLLAFGFRLKRNL